MTARRVTVLLSVALVALLFGLLGGTYALAGIFKKQASELSLSRAKVEQLSTQENGIKQSKRDIAKYQQLSDIAKTVVPQDKDQAATVREITRLASANKVPLTTITFPSSSLGTLPGGAKATPLTAASAAAAAKPNLSQLTLVPGLPGVYNLQITLGNNTTNPVNYTQLTAFLRSLETNRRTAAVSSINIQPQASDPTRLVFSLIINTYIKP